GTGSAPNTVTPQYRLPGGQPTPRGLTHCCVGYHTSSRNSARPPSVQPRRRGQPTAPGESSFMAKEQPKEMTVAEAGRKGGQTVKARYGSDFYGQIGKKGGSTTKKKYGADHYSAIGRRGGRTTADRHGQEFYEEIGKKGGARVKELIERGKQGG